jgi:type I restriction enzyme, S subunit
MSRAAPRAALREPTPHAAASDRTAKGWACAALGEFVDLVAGFPFRSERFSEIPDGGIALVKGENVSQGRILWSISKYWPEAERAEYERFRLRVGDVVVAMDRPWVPAGLKWAFIRERDPAALLVQRCGECQNFCVS